VLDTLEQALYSRRGLKRLIYHNDTKELVAWEETDSGGKADRQHSLARIAGRTEVKDVSWDDLIGVMEESVSSFHPDPEYVEQRLHYLLMNDFLRHLLSLDPDLSSRELKSGFDLVERILRSRDQDVVNVGLDALDLVLQSPDRAQLERFMGRRTKNRVAKMTKPGRLID
jgi:hypothetical protein